jgi:hypothetical protein
MTVADDELGADADRDRVADPLRAERLATHRLLAVSTNTQPKENWRPMTPEEVAHVISDIRAYQTTEYHLRRVPPDHEARTSWAREVCAGHGREASRAAVGVLEMASLDQDEIIVCAPDDAALEFYRVGT